MAGGGTVGAGVGAGIGVGVCTVASGGTGTPGGWGLAKDPNGAEEFRGHDGGCTGVGGTGLGELASMGCTALAAAASEPWGIGL